MNDIYYIFLIPLFYLFVALTLSYLSSKRAYNSHAIRCKKGFILDKNNNFVLTKSLVYRDKKTGREYTGKTMVIK